MQNKNKFYYFECISSLIRVNKTTGVIQVEKQIIINLSLTKLQHKLIFVYILLSQQFQFHQFTTIIIIINHMGACTSAKSNYYQQTKSITSFTQNQLEKFKNTSLKQYKSSLSNVKLKKLKGYQPVSVTVRQDQRQLFQLPHQKMDSTQSFKWHTTFQFDFSMNDYQIRVSHLQFIIKSHKKEIIGQLKVNVFHSATGPYHHDFSLQNLKEARLSFDLKISQMIEIRAETNQTKITLNRELPGDIFMFGIKTNIGNITCDSPYSYMLRIGMTEQLQGNKEVKRTFSTSNKLLKKQSLIDFVRIVKKNEPLVWSTRQNHEMPSFLIKFPFDKFHSSSMEVKLLNADSVQEYELKTMASSYFAFNKIIENSKQEIVQLDNKKFYFYNLPLSQPLRHKGQVIGEISLKMDFYVQDHIKQMTFCVRTESGIMKASPIFTEQDSSNEHIKQLNSIKDEIMNDLLSLPKSQQSRNSILLQKKITAGIIDKMGKIIQILKTSSKQSLIIFVFPKKKQLFRAQKIFLDLGFNAISFLKEANNEIMLQSWMLLSALLARGQFNLEHIGFTQQETLNIRSNKKTEEINKKIQIAIRYQELLYNLLEIALNSLSLRGFDEERAFAQIFIAYAYFRIPAFRQQFLQTIVSYNDPQITQWRGTQFDLRGQISVSTNGNSHYDAFMTLFDWGSHFYKPIEGQEQSKQNKENLSLILATKGWKQRISKRKRAFFEIIKNWVAYIESITVKVQSVNWKYFPGYNKIIRAFLIQLKVQPIQKYPTHLKEAGVKLLKNQKLFNVFIHIIFQKTNSLDSVQVIKCLDMLTTFLLALRRQNKLIPASFDYHNLQRGIKTILNGDFAFCIAKALEVMYEYFDMFSMDFLIHMSLYFLGKVFFKLFLHWSKNVRNIFHHLLTLRIYHQSHKKTSNRRDSLPQTVSQYSIDIRPQYQKAMLMIQNLEKTKSKHDATQILLSYEKQYYKKMKKKRNNKSAIPNAEDLNMRKQVKLHTFQSKHDFHRQIEKNMFDVQKLEEKKLQRYQSQIMSISMIQALQQGIRKRQSSQTTFKIPKQYKDRARQIKQTQVVFQTTGNKAKTRKINIKIQAQQFKIPPPSQQEVKYVKTGFQQYVKTYEIYLKIAKHTTFLLPKVILQIPVDEKETNPQSVQEW